MLGGGLSVRSAVLIVLGRQQCLSEVAPKAKCVLTAADAISIVYIDNHASCTQSDVSRVYFCIGLRRNYDMCV